MKKFNLLIFIIYGLFIIGCDAFLLTEPENNPVGIFDNIWHTFDEEYAVFEERGVNWAQQYSIHRSLVNTGSSEDELYAAVIELLKTLNDGHVNLIAPDRQVFFSNKIRREKIHFDLFDIEVVNEHYLEPGYQNGQDSRYLYGKIQNENIGYIYFEGIGPDWTRFDHFLQMSQDNMGFILDLRHNKGGDFTYSLDALGRLTNTERFVFRSKTKNGPDRSDFTDWHNWYLEPSGEFVEKPIIVLTDRFTISAGERTVMALRALPNVLVIGDTTNGSLGTMIGRELANGWYYSLVPQKVETFDGISYEGTGLPPDIQVSNSLTELSAGIDNVLEKAIAELTEK